MNQRFSQFMYIKVLFMTLLLFTVFRSEAQVNAPFNIYLKNGKIIRGSLVRQTEEKNAIIRMSENFEKSLPLNLIIKSIPVNGTSIDSSQLLQIPEGVSIEDFNRLITQTDIDTTIEFIQLRNSKVLYGNVEYIIIKTIGNEKQLLLDGKNVFNMGEVESYKILGEGLFIRKNEINNLYSFAIKTGSGKIEIFSDIGTAYYLGINLENKTVRFFSKDIASADKYFRTFNGEPLRKFEFENLVPILKTNKACTKYLENYESTNKAIKYINWASWIGLGGTLYYAFSKKNQSPQPIIATVAILGSVISLTSKDFDYNLYKAVKAFNDN